MRALVSVLPCPPHQLASHLLQVSGSPSLLHTALESQPPHIFTVMKGLPNLRCEDTGLPCWRWGREDLGSELGFYGSPFSALRFGLVTPQPGVGGEGAGTTWKVFGRSRCSCPTPDSKNESL